MASRQSPTSAPAASDTVRIYPEVWAAARVRRMAAETETWMMLRGLDRDGRGWLRYADAIQGLQDIYGLSRRSAYRRLQPNQFWIAISNRGEKRMYLHGVVRVCQALELDRAGQPVDIPIEKFRGIAGRRSCVMLAWLTGRSRDGQTKPLPQRRITRAITVSAPTQRRYRQARAEEIKAVRNVSVSNHDLHPDQPGRTSWDPRSGQYFARLPHAYRVRGGERGSHWADRVMRCRTLHPRGGHYEVSGSALRFCVRAPRSTRAGGEAYYVLGRRRGGTQFWEYYGGICQN